MKKWKLINELFERLDGKSFHEFIDDKCPEELKSVCYAPHIGHRAWIFSYKGALICLWDDGNGWWRFHSAVGYLDVMVAKFEEWKMKRRMKERLKELKF